MAQEIALLTADDETGSAVYWPGGQGLWTVYGTWNGATAQLQTSADGGTTWIDYDGVSVTANGGWVVDVPPYVVRVSISGAGGSTSLTSKMKQID